MKEQVGRVLQQGGILADPHQWYCGLAGQWRNDWGADANHLRHTAAKLDELERSAQQVIENIFKTDAAPPDVIAPETTSDPEDPGPIPPGMTEELVPEGGFDAGDVAILTADLAGIVDPTPISDGISGVMSLFKGDWTGAGAGSGTPTRFGRAQGR